ncbi:hypothetical protein LNKW23_07510 [Paralimibaculum aggregatum]|uniref:H+/citrate symporter n=1 Tax=Paralimibaculum aggregatum TaxID=3036245 RepID=A0ABQ6LJY6_9RHOB|nr:hypothetical protein LNKW23_07510 [Limibaculum sp. NKW23]
MLVLLTTAAVTLGEWGLLGGLAALPAALALAALVLLARRVKRTGAIFLGIGIALLVWAAATRADWPELASRAFGTAAFIAAFFTALTTLRVASSSSPAIERCGRYLAQQPPGRRYLALTVGGHLFALLLNYGALALLGGLAEANARSEKNPEVRAHRLRRMLLAVQRGFCSTLPWSPFSFAIAVTLTVVPGLRWLDIVLPALVSSALIAGIGWALDTIFKPRLSGPRPPRQVIEGGIGRLAPLLVLLAVMMVLVGGLHLGTGVRAVGVAMAVVPTVALIWIAIQRPEAPRAAVCAVAGGFAATGLPAYRDELVLLMMAGFIGTMGAPLLGPMLAAGGLDLTVLPAWVLLPALVWLVPLTGQIGMNPILAVTLLGPLLPSPEALGVSPVAMVLAITGGWALSGASSPFTATTLLIGAMGGVSARHVGLVWNGLFTLLTGFALSLWVLGYGLL